MPYATITKPPVDQFRVRPNLTDYEAMRRTFVYESVIDELDGLPGGGLNIAYEAVDRHVAHGRGNRTMMIWEGKDGRVETYSFADMAKLSNRFANVLRSLGVSKGERVFVFMDRVPELYAAVFGTLKAGCVIAPLFSAFGPDAARDRMADAEASVLVTTPEQRHKVNQCKGDVPSLRHIIMVSHGHHAAVEDGELAWDSLMERAPDAFEIERTGPEDPAVMHYTSGTTGKSKGAVHVHKAVLGHYATGKYVLDLHEGDIYWCTADPGWVTGTSYGMFAPWTNGVTSLVYEGGFAASRWYQLIEKHRVTVWYTAPTAIRMLMKAGDHIANRYDLSSLRYVMSVGEPLNPEAVIWGERVLGLPIHDNWWQTETGSIMIANYPVMDIRPGSMGRPMPGIEAAVVDEHGKPVPPGEEGDLVLRPGWPSMFRTYWRNEELYNSRFRNGWYVTGDRARMDEDGYFWFVGRADDVINTAGHLVGPFEVESALIEHPAVAEAGVIGKPDPVAMEIVKAFVTLKDGYEPSEELRRELLHFAREKLGPGVAPREIDFVPSLPKTRSGKIMRRLLKARELGLPEGDTSTLEED
ncbi:MAG TPA: acetate--CoA ligase [Dehalococcoidia bacterium]|nr:acetate--CoA ligase [Dehalococcoidia bacterium]